MLLVEWLATPELKAISHWSKGCMKTNKTKRKAKNKTLAAAQYSGSALRCWGLGSVSQVSDSASLMTFWIPHMCTCVCRYVGLRLTLCVSLYTLYLINWGKAWHLNPNLAYGANLPNHFAPAILSLNSTCWDFRWTATPHTHTSFKFLKLVWEVLPSAELSLQLHYCNHLYPYIYSLYSAMDFMKVFHSNRPHFPLLSSL